MTKTAFILGLFLLFSPAIALAATPVCAANGYTVVFVNGIFDTEVEAFKNKESLKGRLGNEYNGQPVTVQLGYNATHLAGAGDLVQSFSQQFNTSLNDFDLNTILMQIYPEVTTRKLLIVGHSQGAEYANQMYSYLGQHGEPNGSVGVYAVATPANFVAGGGKYITFDDDKVINAVTAAATAANAVGIKVPLPLPANAVLFATPADDASSIGGHVFVDDYLNQAGTQMLSDMDTEMSALKATDATEHGDCFTPPEATLGYKTQAVVFAVADPSAVVLKAGTVTVAKAGAVAVGAVTKVAVGALQFFADTITVTFAPPSQVQTDANTFKVINKLYGSSVDNLNADDKKDLLGPAQGGAVALAIPKPVHTTGVVLGTSTVNNASTTVPYSNGPIIGGQGGPVTPAPVVVVVAADAAPDAAAVQDQSAASTTDTVATTTDTVASSTPVVEASSTVPASNIMASQTDESTLCDYEVCFTPFDPMFGQNGPIAAIDLGAGSTLGNMGILSVTIAKDSLGISGYDATYPWTIQIQCFSDAAYTTRCTDWVDNTNVWNGNRTDVMIENATTTTDGKYWTAYFTNIAHESNYGSQTTPVTFNPNYYYRLTINDQFVDDRVYGSSVTPYFVLRGVAQ